MRIDLRHFFFQLVLFMTATIAYATDGVSLPDDLSGSANKPWLYCAAGEHQPTLPNNGTLCLLIDAVSEDSQISRTANSLIFSMAGHSSTSQTLSFMLPDDAAGIYHAWVNFTNGGQSKQRFTLGASFAGEQSTRRLQCTRGNLESWKGGWQKLDGRMTILPGETTLTIHISGAASDKKIISGFVLQKAEALPPMSMECGRGISQILGLCQTDAPKRYLLLLDGSANNADSGATCLWKALSQALQTTPQNDDLQALYLTGSSAAAMQKSLGLDSSSAAVLLDHRQIVLGHVNGKTAGEIGALLAKTEVKPLLAESKTAGRSAPDENPVAMQNGYPAEWLVAGCWAGPAGMSLHGLGAEAICRPSRSRPLVLLKFDNSTLGKWTARPAADGTDCVIEEPTQNYVWPKGSGYAALYLYAQKQKNIELELSYTGIDGAVWLNGESLEVGNRRDASATRIVEVEGVTDQNNRIRETIEIGGRILGATLPLREGWNRLLVKLVMNHPAGSSFRFTGRFFEESGEPAAGLLTQLSDPEQDRSRGDLQQLLQIRYAVNALADFPYPGQPVALTLTPTYYPAEIIDGVPAGLIPFDGVWTLRVTDYDGNVIGTWQAAATVPAPVRIDLGSGYGPGYYVIQTTLTDAEGHLLAQFDPDGFSVIGGTDAQSARSQQKKMATSYYFLGSKSSSTLNGGGAEVAFNWMRRMGIYRNVGSSPGFNPELWDKADAAGLQLCADFWDIHNSESPQHKQEFAQKSATRTRWFKSFNEVDIVPKTRKTPQHWVERTKIEYEAAHAARADAVYVGGSLVRVVSDDWFEECLKLGLDRYQDRWDVHAYPKAAPVLGGRIGNSPNESEQGVLTVYQKLGRVNKLPFWVGETGARCSHGDDARRWQADMVAKMIACVNSRDNVEVIAFLVPWLYSRCVAAPRQTSRPDGHEAPVSSCGDIQTGHMPAEAAYYTAGALIDGLDYHPVETGDKNLQAGRFGPTLMLWSTYGKKEWTLQTQPETEYLLVDVIGRCYALVAKDGAIRIDVTQSPVYILPIQEYKRLTAGATVTE